MSRFPECPQCGSDDIHADGDNLVCALCGLDWLTAAAPVESPALVRDANGTALVAGDTVIVIKDLKVKGASIPLKQGTVIRNIRLVDGDPDHVEGHSEKIKGLVLKTCFLKKA